MLLEYMFNSTNWDEMGVNVDDKKMNLHYADDTVLVTDSIDERQKILKNLHNSQ